MRSQALIRRMSKLPGENVLIIGVNLGKEAQIFTKAGKSVTGVDLLPSYRDDYHHIRADYEEWDLGAGRYDLIYSAHTLEHMSNPGFVLSKMRDELKEGGWLGIAVPGYTQDFFHVGHLTLWSPALLLYNLVASGWDCSEAEYYTTEHRQSIACLVQKTDTPHAKGVGWDDDIRHLLPVSFAHKMPTWLEDRWSATLETE